MTFLNPLLLLGALGLALPVLAHLINRQQVKKTDWAAMQFLNRSVRVRSRQIRLRDILLLALRCLALIMLVIALARPATTGGGWSWLPGEKRAGVVIALDASFSMAHSDAGESRFDRALKHIDVINENIKPGDPVSLVLLGGEHRVVHRNVAYDPDRLAQTLRDAKPFAEPMDLDSVAKSLQDLVADMDAPQKEVYIVTDTQARGWGDDAAPLRDALKQLANQASVFLVPVAGGSENLAVTDLELVSGTLRKGSVARYQATVENFGESPASNVEVRCLVEGVQIDAKRIPMIAPGATQTVSLFVPFYNAGPTRITAEIDADALQADNIRRTLAVVRERVSILCVDGSSGEAGRLIVSALLARPDGSDNEDYAVRSMQWPSFPIAETTDADIIVLSDVPEITQEQAKQLSRYVREGNGLIWFAGNNVKADKWNALIADNADALLPATLGPVVDTSNSLGVGKPLNPEMPDHAVCRPLGSLPEDLLNETRFLKRIQANPIDTSFPVLSLDSGSSPILLEHSLGRGHVFMFTTSADTAWNNMALTPVFPMLMQQVVTYLVGREFEPPRIVGDTLALSYVQQPDATDAVFDTPSDQTITVPVREHRSQYMAMLDKSQEAGFYTARVSVQAQGMPIAVNVDTRESDVACLTAQQLTQALEGTGVTVSANENDLAADINVSRTSKSSWRLFLLAGLVLLVAESLLADRMLAGKTRRNNQAEGVA